MRTLFIFGHLQRTRWQPEEEAELIRLVKQHGRGNWAAIVAGGQDVFVDRTPVSGLMGRGMMA
jgi:hypothetical protein